MPFNVSLPEFGSIGMNSKDAIISLLSRNFPLNAKEIFYLIKKDFETEITYQAIHKTLKLLESENVLEKVGQKYKLNLAWIERLNNFAKEVEETYSGTQGKYTLKKDFEGVLTFNFDDISVYSRTMAEWFVSGNLIGNGPTEAYGFFRHGIWTLKFNFTEFDLVKKVIEKSSSGYVVVE